MSVPESSEGWLKRLWRAAPPMLPDEVSERIFMRTLTLVTVGAVIGTIGILVGEHPGTKTLLVPAAVFLLLFVAWRSGLRNQARRWSILIWGALLAILGGAFVVGGSRTVLYMAIPIFLTLASWMGRQRDVIRMTAVSLLAFGAVGVLESYGEAIPPGVGQPARFFLQAIILLIGTTLLIELTREYRRHTTAQLNLARENEILLDSVPVMIAALDGQDRYHYANARYARFFGRSPEDLPGRSLGDVIGDASYAEIAPILARLRAQRTACRYRREANASAGKVTLEVELVPYDRMTIADSHETDLTSAPCGFIAVMRDVTEELAGQELLRRSEQKFAALFRSSPVAATISDIQSGRLVDANFAFEMLFGWDCHQVIGRTSAEVGLWRSADERACWLESISGVGATEDVEVILRTRGGDELNVLISSRRITLDGEPRMICLMTDISPRIAAEAEVRRLNETLELRVAERTAALRAAIDELRQSQEILVRTEKLAALGNLVAGVAHELNTPLGNAVTVSSTLQEQGVALRERLESGDAIRRSVLLDQLSRNSEGFDILQRNLTRAHDLIGRFKQMAVDQTSEQRRRFMLDQITADVAASLTPSLRKHGVTLELEVASGIEFDGYPGALGQVLINLVQNADLHAYQLQGGVVRIEGRRVASAPADSADQGELRIIDHGTGIASEHRGRIFEPFFSTKFGQGGSGLGLSISHGLISNALGGTIQVEATPGGGTTFVIHLPLRAPERIAPVAGGRQDNLVAENPALHPSSTSLKGDTS